MAMGSSRIMGRYNATRSPFPMPWLLSTLANLHTSEYSSPYVTTLSIPGSLPSLLMTAAWREP